MSIRPIRNETDYDAALATVSALWGAAVGTQDGDRLEVLAVLIEDYESRAHPIDPPDPIEAIRFRMDQSGFSRRNVEELTGLSRARLSELLNRKRTLTLDHVRKLGEALSIPADVLVQPYAKAG